MYITEPAKRIPVAFDADLCVVGGGCTGVFAAVTAARLGLRVVLVEAQNCLGGTAAGGLVNVWHSLLDTNYKNQVIAGLTAETIDRMCRDGGAQYTANNPSVGVSFQSECLKYQMDRLTQEAGVTLFLHCRFCDLVTEDGRIAYAIVEDKDGRRAIRASFFVDATGDGDLCRVLGMTAYTHPYSQPPTACFLLQGNTDGVDLGRLIHEHGAEFGLDDDWGWFNTIPGMPGITMRADNHVFGVDCAAAADLTRAELIGREQMHAFLCLLRAYGRKDTEYNIVNACSSIGIRDTRHYPTRFRVTETDLLTGRRYEDAVLNGTYRVDVHHSQDNGITFKYLSGETTTIYGKDTRTVTGNWRKEMGLTGEPAVYYQAPFSMLVGEVPNMIAVGRMIHADQGAYGALRVMVNLNQLGEAAGAAAYLALQENATLQALDGRAVRALLVRQGSAL